MIDAECYKTKIFSLKGGNKIVGLPYVTNLHFQVPKMALLCKWYLQNKIDY